MEKFFETLGAKPDFVAYKEESVKKALEYGAVDILLLSREYDRDLIKELKR